MVGTKALGSIDKFWPLAVDSGKKKIEPMTKERYEAILKRHNIKAK